MEINALEEHVNVLLNKLIKMPKSLFQLLKKYSTKLVLTLSKRLEDLLQILLIINLWDIQRILITANLKANGILLIMNFVTLIKWMLWWKRTAYQSIGSQILEEMVSLKWDQIPNSARTGAILKVDSESDQLLRSLICKSYFNLQLLMQWSGQRHQVNQMDVLPEILKNALELTLCVKEIANYPSKNVQLQKLVSGMMLWLSILLIMQYLHFEGINLNLIS